MSDTTKSMTARMASGGGSLERGAAINAFRSAGTLFSGTDSLDQQALNTILTAVYDVLNDTGLPPDTVLGVESVSSLRNGAAMATQSRNVLAIPRNIFSDPGGIKEIENSTSKSFAASGIRGLATHESGHVVMNALSDKLYANESNLERSNRKKKNTAEKRVIKEASKRYGSNPRISTYGSTSFGEKVAEAFSDVYTNGNNSNPYSKVIVDVSKEMLKA